MEGPRAPLEQEVPHVLDFLTKKLRSEAGWSIAAEYPTAFHASNIHNMRIIADGPKLLSHAVLKPLIIKTPQVIFKVGAIGSVVTDEDARGQGLSSTIIKECLDAATHQNCDFTILWTNLFDFYRKFGFELAGSELSFIIEENFVTNDHQMRFSNDYRVSPEAIHRLYSTHTVSSVRSLDETRRFMSIPNTQIYTAWDPNGQLAAYAIEGKGADLKGYIHEWGGNVNKLMALFSWIRKTKNEAFTVIVPGHSENLIRHLSALPVTKNEGYLGMIKITNFDQLAAKVKRAFRAEGVADIVLERHTDHYLFGIGNELFTLTNEQDMVKFLFGPVDYADLGIFSEATIQKFNKVLPLKLWIWGWDSI